MKRLLWVAIAVALGAFGLNAGPASAATSSGVEHWQVLSAQGQPGLVLAEGLFNALGRAHDNISIDPVAGTFSNHAHMDFPDGEIFFHSAGRTALTFLGPACVGMATVDGRFDTDSGTGRYTNLTGSGTLKGYVILVFTPTVGGCSTAPIVSLAVASATGTMRGLRAG